MADVIQFPMTPEQFVKAQKALDATTTHAGDSNSGSVVTSQLSFDYDYDGTNLSMTITAKHGIAKFASDNAIKSHIAEMLAAL